MKIYLIYQTDPWCPEQESILDRIYLNKDKADTYVHKKNKKDLSKYYKVEYKTSDNLKKKCSQCGKYFYIPGEYCSDSCFLKYCHDSEKCL